VRHLLYDDYSEGAHPAILDAIREANSGQEMGYGHDSHSALAARRIIGALGVDADVQFVSGGTQANLIGLAAMLRPHEGVVAAQTAHINVNETGAVEATGHKVITLPSADGKVTAAMIDEACALHTDEHTVKPRVVFLSQATERGTVYSVDELHALVDHAHRVGLLVYLDGARLAMAVAAWSPSMLHDLAALGVDVLYIGGTKNGGLFGEALVLCNPAIRTDFRYIMKQRGGLLAKGRAIGAQFARFFADDGLWLKLGADANASAHRLGTGLAAAGIELVQPVVTNQVFALLDDAVVEPLSRQFGFYVWERRGDGQSVVRLVCSWATPDEAVDEFIAAASPVAGSR
jgi:threonine aldolase